MDEPNGDGFHLLDEDAISFFAAGIKQIESINTQMNGALQLYVKQHKLQGQWRLAENGRELQRIEEVANAGTSTQTNRSQAQ